MKNKLSVLLLIFLMIVVVMLNFFKEGFREGAISTKYYLKYNDSYIVPSTSMLINLVKNKSNKSTISVSNVNLEGFTDILKSHYYFKDNLSLSHSFIKGPNGKNYYQLVIPTSNTGTGLTNASLFSTTTAPTINNIAGDVSNKPYLLIYPDMDKYKIYFIIKNNNNYAFLFIKINTNNNIEVTTDITQASRFSLEK